jgi:hypothetical protein
VFSDIASERLSLPISAAERDNSEQARLREYPTQLRAVADEILRRSLDMEKWRKEHLNSPEGVNETAVAESVNDLLGRIKLAINLLDAADKLDHHSLPESEVNRLFAMRPRELAKEALRKGEFRERRLVLQAREAETNQRLAITAGCAAIIALIVPFLSGIPTPWSG